MNKKTFYLLSFTWGLPMTIIGCVVALALIICGYKPKKFGYCYYFTIGNNWGGLELGLFFLTDKSENIHTLKHEHGHALDNCLFGFFMPFIVCIPSAIRYWYREFRYHRKGIIPPTLYDDFWVENRATKRGYQFMKSVFGV